MSTVLDPNAANQNSTPLFSPTQRKGKGQPLGLNARRVISKRYSLKDAQSNPIEEWPDIVRRVVGHVSVAEPDAQGRDEFYAAMTEIMLEREFVPNTPCLVNAGKSNGQLAACFVLEVPDSISGIMDHAKAAATIHQTGGGCIAADARVWTTFCGLEPIEVLFNRATAAGRAGVLQGRGTTYNVEDLNIKTVALNPQTGESGLRQGAHVWKFEVAREEQIVVKTGKGGEGQREAWHPSRVLRGYELGAGSGDEVS